MPANSASASSLARSPYAAPVPAHLRKRRRPRTASAATSPAGGAAAGAGANPSGALGDGGAVAGVLARSWQNAAQRPISLVKEVLVSKTARNIHQPMSIPRTNRPGYQPVHLRGQQQQQQHRRPQTAGESSDPAEQTDETRADSSTSTPSSPTRAQAPYSSRESASPERNAFSPTRTPSSGARRRSPAAAGRRRSASLGQHRYSAGPHEHVFESAQSRARSLAVQALRAAAKRDWNSLVSLRIEQVCFAKIIHGRGAPAVVLAELALSDAYLRAGLPKQAYSHAVQLVGRLEQMEYAQGGFDCQMTLGRSAHMMTREPMDCPTAVDIVRMLEKSRAHFMSAIDLTWRGHESFFAHTTIRSEKEMDSVTIKKRLEARLALASILTAAGEDADAQKELTECWEMLDGHLRSEGKRDAAAKMKAGTEEEDNNEATEHARSLSGELSTSSTPKPSKGTPSSSSINSSLLALPLYLSLGRCFLASGDAANAVDSLKRCVFIAEAHPRVTLAEAMKTPQEQWNETTWPTDAGKLEFDKVKAFMTACELLAQAYSSSSDPTHLQAAVAMQERLRTLMRNVKKYNDAVWKEHAFSETMPANAASSNPSSPSSSRSAASPLPAPLHTPTSSTSVSHAAIDSAWARLLSASFGYDSEGSQPTSYNAGELSELCSERLLHLAVGLSSSHANNGDWEKAAECMEEVCERLEGEGDEESQQQESPDLTEEDPNLFSYTTPLTTVPQLTPAVTGVYSLEVARARRRLGECYLKADQPRSACAQFQNALQILETTYGYRRVHSLMVKYSTHSGFRGGEPTGAHKKAREEGGEPELVQGGGGARRLPSPVKKRISTGFGTTIPNPTFVAAKSLLTSMHGGAHAQQGVDTSGEVSQTPDAAKVKAALERTIPPHVLRMMEALRREIRKLEEQARQEEQAENGAAEESCHSPAAAVAEEQSSTAQSDQPLQYQPDFPSAADEYGAYMGEDGGEEQQQQQEQQQNENTESYDGQGYFQSASQQNLTPPAPTTTGSAGGVESSDDAYASDAFDSPSSPGGGSPATRSKAKLLHPIASHLYQPPEIENEWTSVEKHDRRLELGVQTTQAERLNFQPPAGVYAAPARRYVQIIQSADPVREGNAVPKSPHVVLAERGGVGERKFDHLLGDSGVFSEALLLRTIGSPSTTAQASRLAAYDAYTAEKNTSLHHLQAEFPEVAAAPADRMEPVKAARQTRPLSGTPKKPVPPPPATLTEVHDALGGFTVLANGEVEFVSKHESEAKTEPIDFSQFANLGL